MDWLTQNWSLILVAGVFGWMMFGRRGAGGGCCGGMGSEPEPRKTDEGTAPPARVKERR